VSDASVVLFSEEHVDAVRAALHGIWDTATPYEIIVMASRCDEEIAGYLMRQYRRGKISSFAFDMSGHSTIHCGLDRGFHFAGGRFLVRTQDGLVYEPGWLEQAIDALEAAPEIGCLGLVEAGGRRRRGRPPKPRHRAVLVERVDTTCFITRHEVFERHESELLGERLADHCAYQVRLGEIGMKVAFYPGLVKRAGAEVAAGTAVVDDRGEIDADLPAHDLSSGKQQRIHQVYELGEDVLLTCMSCGNNELEVQAATVEFCPAHGSPVGYTYTLRCGSCREVQYQEDMQLRCPG
jgi:predicted RNA-binding Zn-ribbon protein involved in translation (DUF1610 family)